WGNDRSSSKVLTLCISTFHLSSKQWTPRCAACHYSCRQGVPVVNTWVCSLLSAGKSEPPHVGSYEISIPQTRSHSPSGFDPRMVRRHDFAFSGNPFQRHRLGSVAA